MIWSGKNTQRKYAMAATFARKYVTYPQDCEGDVNNHKRRKMESFVILLHTSTLSELRCRLFCCGVDVILPRSPLRLPSPSSILPRSRRYAGVAIFAGCLAAPCAVLCALFELWAGPTTTTSWLLVGCAVLDVRPFLLPAWTRTLYVLDPPTALELVQVIQTLLVAVTTTITYNQ
jgi:hypothetical protein